MPKSNPLEKHRRQIDLIDTKLVALLNERARMAKEIGRIKTKNGENVFDSARESDILTRLVEKNKGPLPHDSIEDIFTSIFSSCRSLQKRLEVAYLGPEAT